MTQIQSMALAIKATINLNISFNKAKLDNGVTHQTLQDKGQLDLNNGASIDNYHFDFCYKNTFIPNKFVKF